MNQSPISEINNKIPFSLTLIKSTNVNKVYAKNLETNTISLPYFNDFTTFQSPDFKQLYNYLKRLLSQKAVAQILGKPTRLALKNKINSLPVRRIKQNFDFYDVKSPSNSPTLSSSYPESPFPIKSVTYNYLLLDIDNLDESLYIPEFKSSYEEQNLTPLIINHQVNKIIVSLFSPLFNSKTLLTPVIVRLSSTFGLGEKIKFKAHLYIPLSKLVPIEDLSLFLSRFKWVDVSSYRNPTQPMFTSSPITQSEDLNPLSSSQHNLPRLFFFNPDSPYIDSNLIYQILNKPTPSNSNSNPHAQASFFLKSTLLAKQKKIHATRLPGYKGVFNRASETNKKYSISTILTNLGYTSPNGIKWLSPNSTSKSPGGTLFPDGFFVDFHDNSPVKTLIQTHNPIPSSSFYSQTRRLSAYDIYYLWARSRNEEKIFQNQLKFLAARDPIYQTYWEKEIISRLSYITFEMSITQVEPIVKGLVEDIFFAGLTGPKRSFIFDEIVNKIKTLKLKKVKITKSYLNQTYNNLRKNLSLDLLDIHPANPEEINTKALHKLAVLSRVPHSPGAYYVENDASSRLDFVATKDELRLKLFRLYKRLSVEEGWSLNKIQANINFTLNDLDASLDHELNIKVSPHLYAFRPENNIDPLTAYNIRTHQQVDITLQNGVLHELPFTQKEYNRCIEKCKSMPFDQTPWGNLLSTSLENPHKIQYLRQFFSYIFTPRRKSQIILAFIGITRSGKSTIKNLLTSLFPHPFSLEKSPKTLGRDISALHDLTFLTRLLIINEFNAQEIAKSTSLGQIVNDLKSMSGRDEVTVRAMRENVTGLKTDAVPLIISNELPTITDPAFQSRIHLIKFNNSFPGGNNIQFWEQLQENLPFIFYWAITNPRIQRIKKPYPSIAIDIKRPTGEVAQEKNQLNKEMDLITYFIKSFTVSHPEGWISKKDFKYFYCCFYLSETGMNYINETRLKQLGLQDFKKVYPKVEIARSIKSRVPLSGETGTREWGILGARWKDPEALVSSLSEFVEYVE